MIPISNQDAHELVRIANALEALYWRTASVREQNAIRKLIRIRNKLISKQ